MATWSALRKQLTEVGREARRLLIERKVQAKNGSLQNTLTDSKGTIFVVLKNHANVPFGKENESNKQSKERGQQKSVCGKGRDARQSQKLLRNR